MKKIRIDSALQQSQTSVATTNDNNHKNFFKNRTHIINSSISTSTFSKFRPHSSISYTKTNKTTVISNRSSSPNNSNFNSISKSSNNKSHLQAKQQQQQQQQPNNNNSKTLSYRQYDSFEDDNNDLYEMIEKVQGARLDSQRCELSQNYSVTKFLDNMLPVKQQDNFQQQQHQPLQLTKSLDSSIINTTINNTTTTNNKIPNIDSQHTSLHQSHSIGVTSISSQTASISRSTNSKNYSPERLFKLISSYNNNNIHSNDHLTPMISLPDNNTYWFEGWSVNEHLNLSLNSEKIILPNNINVMSAIKIDKDELVLRDSIIDKDHLDFYGQDGRETPIILSYKIDVIDGVEHIKSLLRTKEENIYMNIPYSSIKEPVIPHKICKLINPSMKIKFLQPILIPNGTRLIKNFDDHTNSKTYKFGIIYMKKGQTTEEELFSNPTHSESFEEFLNFIGTRIKLKDFKGYKGGLDTVNGQTGEESVYEKYHDREVMFHVSTLLPHSKSDNQQLERKRHIGNDIVSIVFQEDNTPFAPDMIASNFLHSFIIVQKVTDNDSKTTKYRVGVTARSGVPNFTPDIPKCCTFEKSELFKEWLIMKLMNAEAACCKSEKFKKLKDRTRNTLIEELYSNIHEQNQKLMQALQQTNTSCSSDKDSYNDNSSRDSSNSVNYTITNGTSKEIVSKQLADSTHVTNNVIQTSANTNSASFKFSLFNTVRKAFNTKLHKSHHDKSDLVKNNMGNSTLTLANGNGTLPSNVNNDNGMSSMSGQQLSKTRLRSVTVDGPNSLKFQSSKSVKEHRTTDKQQINENPEEIKRTLIEFSNQNLNFPNSKSNTNNTNNNNTFTKLKQHSELNLNDISNRMSSSYYETSSPSTTPETESSPIVTKNGDINSFHPQRTIQSSSCSSQDNVVLVDDSDTGLSSLTPNSSGISSSTSFVTESNDNTIDTLCENLIKTANNPNNIKSNVLRSQNYKKRAEPMNEQLNKLKRIENKGVIESPNEIF